MIDDEEMISSLIKAYDIVITFNTVAGIGKKGIERFLSDIQSALNNVENTICYYKECVV